MLVSIITSVYNCQDYAGEMLESFLNQTYQDWECIIIDDASTDHTWNVIKQYNDKRIITIHNKQNEGLTRNLNKGIALAKGKYLIRIDGDDKAFPTRLEKQVDFMENHPEVVVSGSYMQNFGQRYDTVKAVLDNDRLRVHMLFNSVMYHPTFIIRREILNQYDICYDEDFRFAQDYNLLYQLMQHGELANIPEPLVKRRVHGDQIGMTRYEQQRKCADNTRKLMLKLLGTALTEQEEMIWLKWCVDCTFGCTDDERETIQAVLNRIMYANRKTGLFKQDILEKSLRERIHRSSSIRKEDTIKEKDKYQRLFQMMNQWVRVKQEGKNVAEYLARKGYKKIAVYGMGCAGETLFHELLSQDIEIAYFIDRNAENLHSDIPVVAPDNITETVDSVIVTAITFYDEIKAVLRDKTESPIVSLEEIVFDL